MLLYAFLHLTDKWLQKWNKSPSSVQSSSFKLTSIESVMPSSHLILCRPVLLLPPIPPSIRVFSNKSTHHMRWPKYWSFSFSIIPSKDIPGLISFRMDWLDLLAVQGTLKNLLQHHSSKASQEEALSTVKSRGAHGVAPPFQKSPKCLSPLQRTTPQFKSINSSTLSFLHSPTFTSIHDYWKNHSLD